MNPLVARLTPGATKLIRSDHAAAIALFHRLERSLGRGPREAIARQLCTALEIHAQLEEEIFYPALREARIELPQLARSEPEHDEMRRLIGRVRASEGEDAQPEAVCELMRAVMHHIAEEETQLLPAAESLIGGQLDALGVRMTERRLQLAKPHLGEMAVDRARASPGQALLLLGGTLLAATWLFGGSRPNGREQTRAREPMPRRAVARRW